MIRDIKESIVNHVINFLEWIDFDPFYAVTIFIIIIAFSYRNDINNWHKIQFWQKGLVLVTCFAAIVFSLISLLRLFGIIHL